MALVPSSLLLFLVLSSVWVALSLPLPVAAAQGQGEHCPPFSCGDVNISFPFGLIPEGAGQTNCGGGIGFQVRCHNNIPYLGSYQSEHDMQILSIFYHNHSLLIADRHWPAYFNISSTGRCHTFPTSTSSHLAPPFSISSVNQNLIFYNCNKPLPPLAPGWDPVETVCHKAHNITFVFAADGRPDESEGSYFMEGCTAAMVAVLGVPGKVNASNYEQLVWDGFLATWQWMPPPSPSGKIIISDKAALTYLGGAYYWDKPPAPITTWRCQFAYMPLLGSEAAANYSRLLKDGFVVDWEVAGVGDCQACNASGGQCRYDSSDGAEFWCHCPDGRRARPTCAAECSPSPGVNFTCHANAMN